MIKSLNLTNFRRHEDLQLRFDDDAQLIVINGPNGAGKSSILEAIVFALYGESRQGRKNLDRLTKRGSELEGMSVELVFTVADTTYRVHRRRDGKASTAVLYANEIGIVEGPIGVTEEITKILGMDSAGFRLAAIAQQKDLDGLASLRPAERAQMMTRLLRLDALTAAKTQASGIFRRERELVAGLRNDNTEVIESELKDADLELDASQAEYRSASDALTLIDAELAATRDVETLWTESARNVSRITGMVDELTAGLAKFRLELDTLVVPDALETNYSISELAQEGVELERALAQAQQAAREAQQRHAVQAELTQVETKLDEIARALQEVLPEAQEREQERKAALEALTGVEAQQQDLLARKSRLEANLDSAKRRLEAAQELGAQCEACGQEVDPDHQHRQVEQAQEQVGEVQRELDLAGQELALANENLTRMRDEVRNAEQNLTQAVKAQHQRDLVEAERDELTRRAATYRSQLERLTSEPVDVDDLYARKAQVAIAIEEAKAAEENLKLRAQALGRKDSLASQAEEAAARLEQAKEDLAVAGPSADLQARYQERQTLLESRLAEQDMLNHWKTQVAIAQNRKAALAKSLEVSQSQRERMLKHQQVAISAGAAGRLLGDVSEKLSTMIRPSLQASIGSLLTTMSQGRFDSVSISDDYDITVLDDGKYRSLEELSGGEVDLVALATRLALASIVTERHGDGGIGFLILDECFGSQDPQRRAAILEALRNLRSTYRQIFLISHVENVEDAADVLVNVDVSDDRSETLVSVS